MAQLFCRLLQVPKTPIRGKVFTRGIGTSRCAKCATKNYQGDGKTTVTILNREYRDLIMIDTLSTNGFRLNNGIFVLGPMATFPRTILQWNVTDVESITPESLSLFTLLEPKIDIFVLGTGDKCMLPRPEVLEFFKEKKISTEILMTEKACSVFNFLNAEGRCVAGAFLPPTRVTIYEEDMKLLGSLDTLPESGYLL